MFIGLKLYNVHGFVELIFHNIYVCKSNTAAQNAYIHMTNIAQHVCIEPLIISHDVIQKSFTIQNKQFTNNILYSLQRVSTYSKS